MVDRKHCSKECGGKYRLKLIAQRYLLLPKCKTDDCNGKATRISYGLCESCYYRLRRNGSTKKNKPKYRYLTKAGYIRLLNPKHPLSQLKGYVYEHRLVVYNYYNGEPQECYWCGKAVGWDKVVIDHLNENKADNRIKNLIYSCNN